MKFSIILCVLAAYCCCCFLPATSALRCLKRNTTTGAEHAPTYLSKTNCTKDDILELLPVATTKRAYKSILEMDHEDDITEFLFKQGEPSWMDSCRRRPELPMLKIFHDLSKFNLMEAPDENERRENEPWLRGLLEKRSRLMEADRRVNAENSTESKPQQLRRRKRSSAISVLSLKNQFQKSTSQADRYHQHKNRYLIQPTDQPKPPPPPPHYETFVVVPTIKPTTTTPEPPPQWVLDMGEEELRNYTRIKQLVWSLYKLNIKITWNMLAAHAAANNLQQQSTELIYWINNFTIQYEQDAGPLVSEQRRSEILTAKRKWLPTYNELIIKQQPSLESLYNFTAGLNHEQTRLIMFNLTHYLQFFAVATEQMRFDQENFLPHRQPIEHQVYKHVDDFVLKLLCDCDNLLNLLRDFEKLRGQFERALVDYKPKKMERYGEYYEHLLAHTLARDLEHVSGPLEFESAIERKYRSLSPEQQIKYVKTIESFMEWASEEDQRRAESDKERKRFKDLNQRLAEKIPATYPTFIWREIMPLEQRQLYTVRERAVRDLSILEDIAPIVEVFRTLFYHNHQ